MKYMIELIKDFCTLQSQLEAILEFPIKLSHAAK